MFIKEITISGFKSYKGDVVIPEFHPGFNIVVGRNGSGKSNLFTAIEFALTLEYRHLNAQDRSALLHDGKKAAMDMAFVEIVFDNADRRLPVDSDTVTFRRMLGAKKDKFFCNKKELSNAKQFLDIAGFTNPYFIVKQGKVHQLATSKDGFRLKVLEDVAGSTAIDQQLLKCEKSIKDAEEKRKECEKNLKEVEERMKTLEEEAKDLKQFMDFDSKRRSIEHILNDREQEMYRRSIGECEDARTELNEELEPHQRTLQNLQEQSRSLEKSMKEVEDKITRMDSKKEGIEATILELVAEETKLRNDLEDCENGMVDGVSAKTLGKEVERLQAELETAEVDLSQARQARENVSEKVNNVEKKIIETDVELKSIEGRLSGKDSKDLKSLAKSLNDEIKTRSDRMEKIVGELEKLKSERAGLTEGRSGISNIKSSLAEIVQQLSTLDIEASIPDSDLFNNERRRKELWDNLSDTNHQLHAQKNMKGQMQEQLRKLVGRDNVNQWDGIKDVLEELRREGDEATVDKYYGILANAITYKKDLEVALESAAKNKLFYHIVKDRATAMKILRKFNAMKKGGSPNFLPLDILNVIPIDLPRDNRSFRQLMEFIQCPSELKKAAEYVFGKTVVCKELADASKIVKEHKVDCVTTDGDKVSRKGLMTGGYIGDRQGSLHFLHQLQKLDQTISSLQDHKRINEVEIEELNQVIEEANKSKLKRDNKRFALGGRRQVLEMQLKNFQISLKHHESSITVHEAKQLQLERELHELNCRKQRVREELNRDEDSTSSQEDRATVVQLREYMKNLTSKKKKLVEQLMTKETLVSNLSRNVEDLQAKIDETSINRIEAEINSSQNQNRKVEEIKGMIKTVKQEIKDKKREVNELVEKLEEWKAEMSDIKLKVDRLQDNEKQIPNEMHKHEKKLDKLVSSIASYTTKLHEVIQSATKLGTLPPDADRFRPKPSKILYEQLNKINRYLHGVDGINQKAAEQYEELLRKYASFKDRLDSLSSAKQEIEDVMQDMQLKKADAIFKNFAVLQTEFKKIFKQIVPNGTGELQLYGDGISIDAKTKNLESTRDKIISDGLKGMRVLVNFMNKRVIESSDLMHLSGGQKSIVALCLILAIQKIDPVPFYLFDEVDQALDPAYRAAVTKIIRGIATEFHLQFICTTFRREFLGGAHKCFGVSIHRGRSQIRPISIAEAKDFVETDTCPGIGTEGSSSSASSPSGDDDESQDDPNNNNEGENGSEDLFAEDEEE